MQFPDSLIDTCCLLNVCAIGDPSAVLRVMPARWHIARAAAAEEISIRPAADAQRHERRPIDLKPCFDSGVLTACEPQDEQEQAVYVQLAMEVDDGEAMSLAIASCRRWSVATDDLAARRVARRLGVQPVSTPELVNWWATRSGIDAPAVAQAIHNIETLARYVPAPTTPGFEWWQRAKRA